MFAAQSAKGGAMTKELKRHLEHQSIQAAKAAEELAKKQTKIRLNIHAKGASDLIAVDNRQFSMTSSFVSRLYYVKMSPSFVRSPFLNLCFPRFAPNTKDEA